MPAALHIIDPDTGCQAAGLQLSVQASMLTSTMARDLQAHQSLHHGASFACLWSRGPPRTLHMLAHWRSGVRQLLGRLQALLVRVGWLQAMLRLVGGLLALLGLVQEMLGLHARLPACHC